MKLQRDISYLGQKTIEDQDNSKPCKKLLCVLQGLAASKA